jgi:hypothetical protein
MKLKKLLLTMLIMMLSTGVLFACSAEDPEEPATEENQTEQEDNGDTEETEDQE